MDAQPIRVSANDIKVGDTVITKKQASFTVPEGIFAREHVFTNVHSTCVEISGGEAILIPFKEEPVYLEL